MSETDPKTAKDDTKVTPADSDQPAKPAEVNKSSEDDDDIDYGNPGGTAN